MKKLSTIYLICFALLISGNIKAQDTLVWNETKGRAIIKKIDDLMEESKRLKKDKLAPDTASLLNIDTIIQEATRFKMALRRRDKYAQQYKEDFNYYSEQLNYAFRVSDIDSIHGIISDVKEDLLLKKESMFDMNDSTSGPGSTDTDFRLVNFRVRVFGADGLQPLNGYEVYIKRGIYIPSKDSVRIPQLTDNAVMPISPGNFTIVAWKGSQGGKAPAQVTRMPEFICDIKLQ